jgi:AcrR family transcriptional regulator
MAVSMVPASRKDEIVRVAERLFAEQGFRGVSLRQIAVEAGTVNHSAVHYHFGSKDQLVRAIFEYRVPDLNDRRRILVAERQPTSVRSWVECYMLPILEQGEQAGSHYLRFVGTLQHSADRWLFELIAPEHRRPTNRFRAELTRLMSSVPEPLRSHRIAQAIMCAVQASADRERAHAAGIEVLPFALHVADLLDGLVGFLNAPASPRSLAVLGGSPLMVEQAACLPL